FAHLPRPTIAGTAAADGDTLGDGPDEFVELKPGVLYRFSLSLSDLDNGEARVLVQGENLPQDRLAQLALAPLSALEQAGRAVLLLSKALQLLQTLGLGEGEARYLLTHAADFGDLDLSALPTLASNDTPAGAAQLFAQLLHLAGYASLKRELAGDTADLVGVFEANELGDLEQVYSLLARLARREVATVRATSNALFAAPAFAGVEPLRRLWGALQVVERFGVEVRALRDWTGIVARGASGEERFALARDLRETIKARFEPEAWQRVAQPIFDGLRRRQRDALVAHVMQQHGFARVEQLYEYFLIDPAMEPVVQTSRIRLAIASLQLFIQRCLLNLERDVHPTAIINAGQWEWMKRYRVWEANRKIFLFPENWLEPEFRDDKTHLFAELEGALLQGDVSDDLVEDAFLAYLKKLEELARLDIVAMHLEDKDDPAQNVLHVFGRTYSLPHKYFYRRYAHQTWAPWEPMGAEIEGDHLAPVIWRGRPYLFWVTFAERAAVPAGKITVDFKTAIDIQTTVAKKMEAQLHWSEYVDGAWSTRESSEHTPPDDQKLIADAADPRSVFVHVTKEFEAGEERGVLIHLGSPFTHAFHLAGRNSAPERVPSGAPPANPYGTQTKRANRYSGAGLLSVTFTQRSTTEPGKGPKTESQPILSQPRSHTLLPTDNELLANLGEVAALIRPIFYQDSRHTFFVEPSVAEQTLEDWQEWVTRTPQPEREWLKPDWWDDRYIIPEIPDFPERPPLPFPDDPFWQTIDPGVLVKLRAGQDWVRNPATGLLFGDELIGPQGRTGLAVLPATELGEALAAGAQAVHVHGGSSVASDSVVVLKGGASLADSGLTQVAGGLNVVGGGGFSAPLKENFVNFNAIDPIGR
ncbi:MAG: hypothetical protein HGA45_19380, partial [Chloroflexales bacterium]|nr:hypothetical protein [Chloroflexales bacterium]